MKKYLNAIGELEKRTAAKWDPQNQTHKILFTGLKRLGDQVRAIDTLSSVAHDAGTMMRALNRLSTLTDAEELNFNKLVGETQKSFEAALREKAGLTPGPYGPELRARLHAMNPGERVKAVHELIKAHDGSTLAAIFDAPSMLTGLSEADISTFREQYYQTACPGLVKARDTFQDLSEHVGAAVNTCRKISLEYSDPAKLKELEAQEAAVKAAQGE